MAGEQLGLGIAIEAVDRTSAATQSAKRNVDDLDKSVKKFKSSQMSLNFTNQQTPSILNQVKSALSSLGQSMDAAGINAQRLKDRLATAASGLGELQPVLAALPGAFSIVGLAIGAAAVGLTALAKHAAEVQEQTENLQVRLGYTAEGIGALRIVASEAGVSFDAIAAGVDRLNRQVGKAREGNEEAQKSFKELGVSLEDQHGKFKTTEELTSQVAHALMQIQDPAERSRLAFETLGRGGARYLRALQFDMEESKKRALELGITLSGNLKEGAIKADQSFDRLGTAMHGLWNSLSGIAAVSIAPLIEQVASLAEVLAKAAKSAADLYAGAAKAEKDAAALAASGLVITQAGEVLPRQQAQAEAQGDFSKRKSDEFKRNLGLIVPGSVWPPPGPKMDTSALDAASGATKDNTRAIDELTKAVETITINGETFDISKESRKGLGTGGTTISGVRVQGLGETPKGRSSTDEGVEEIFLDTKKSHDALAKSIKAEGDAADNASQKGNEFSKILGSAITGAFQAIVESFISGVDDIGDALGHLVESMISQIAAASFSKFVLGPLGLLQGGGVLMMQQGGVLGSAGNPYRAQGGIVRNGIRGVDSVHALVGRGEAYLDHTLTDMLRDFLTKSVPRNQVTNNYTIQMMGGGGGERLGYQRSASRSDLKVALGSEFWPIMREISATGAHS